MAFTMFHIVLALTFGTALRSPSLVHFEDVQQHSQSLQRREESQDTASNVIVLETVNTVTGGPEALWQLGLSLSSFEHEGWHVSITTAPSDHWVNMYPDSRQLRIWDQKRPWRSGDILIVPEISRCDESLIQRGVQVWVWLLGYVDNNLQHWGKCKLIGHTHFLTTYYHAVLTIRPYISQNIVDDATSHGLSPDGRFSRQFLKKKQNLVLIDNDAIQAAGLRESFLTDLKSALQSHGAEVEVVTGYSRSQTLELFAKAKFVIDFCMRGAERMPIEASLHGAVFVTNACLEGDDHEDFSLPSKFVMRTPDVASFVHLMKDAMSSNLSEYARMVDAQIEHRRYYLSLGRKSMNEDVSTFLSVLRKHE